MVYVTRLNVPALMSGDSFSIPSALHATRHTPRLYPSFSGSLVGFPVDATRHTPHIPGDIFDHFVTGDTLVITDIIPKYP